MIECLKDNTLLKNKCLINGEWVDSETGNKIDVVNPFDLKTIGHIPMLPSVQVNVAITAANEAFQTWKKTTAFEKANVMKKWLHLIHKNVDDLAAIIVTEQGKPLKEAIEEVNYAASYVQFYAEEAIRIYGDILQSPFPHSRAFVIKQPVGVVGIITPWNFPIAMMIRKIAPALACGCTCVIKPDEKTPLSALAILELAMRSGIPKGVLNAVTGIPAEIGKLFTESSIVRKISFTGSTNTGKTLVRDSAKKIKKLTLELGGNALFIVFDDANIEDAVDGLIMAKFRNGGQTCICANRIFIHHNIIDIFVEKLTYKVKSLKVGNGFDEVDIGPLINRDALDKMLRLIQDAKLKGATVCEGGIPHTLGGTFFEPTILSGVNHTMDIFNEEIFGPIAPLISFNSESEVLEFANDSKYGLAAYFYTKDMARIWRVAEALEYGMLGINRTSISSPIIPFGGIKESGMGREGSKYGMDDYLDIKYVCLSD